MNYRMSILIVELQRSSKLNAENFMKEFQISYRTLKNDIEAVYEADCEGKPSSKIPEIWDMNI